MAKTDNSKHLFEDGRKVAVKGTGPREISRRPEGDGKPPGKQPILPRDKAKAEKKS